MGRLLNCAMFCLGWFACVMGAGHGQLWLGASVVAGLVLLHLYAAPRPAQEIRLILLTGVFGFAIDTLQASAGLSLVGIAVVWACVMPSLLWLREFLATSTVHVPLRSPAGAL